MRTGPGSQSSSGSTGRVKDLPATDIRVPWDGSVRIQGATGVRFPAREYTVNDCVKINLARVFEVALHEMMADPSVSASVAELWERFERHLRRSVAVVAQSLDFHIDHMYRVFPELHMDLLCHGPIERGRDASHGGVEYVNLCVDASGLATVADSFAALEQRVDQEGRYSWTEMMHFLDSDWAGPDGERARLMMRKIPRYGSGGSRADAYAVRISETFTAAVKEKPTPHGYNMIPGLFSWAANLLLGKDVGATPNGRHARAMISHGPNPDPGFRKDAAPTALANAVASVQPGYGNTAPMQIELDPGISRSTEDIANVAALIRTHFDLGGTQININILDKKTTPRGSRRSLPAPRPCRAGDGLQCLLRQPFARDAPDGGGPHPGTGLTQQMP